jgi:hypothetical protein
MTMCGRRSVFTHKKFGIVAAQKRIPEIIGCAIADVADDEHSLRRAVFQILRSYD